MNYWKEELYRTFLIEFPKYYQDSSAEYFPSASLPSKLNVEELQVFNREINMPNLVGCEKDQVLHQLLQDRSKDNFTFYVFNRLEFECDVNSLNESKNTVFIEVAKRFFEAEGYFEDHIILTLFKRGYKIKEEDILFVIDLYKKKKSEKDLEKWMILRFATKLNDLKKFEIAINNKRELFTMLSFKMNRPISFNFPNLLGVAVNAIIYYRENGDIILRSIDRFKKNDNIIKLDQRKHTFKRKRMEYLENRPIQNKEFESVAIELFPELN